MLITKKVGIQTDSGALCPYFSITITWSLQCGQKTKLVKFVHITIFGKFKNFSSTEMQYLSTVLVIHTAILLSYCNITL